MLGWFRNLNDADRRVAIDQASFISGIPSHSIEKDLWVTVVLHLLFSSKYAKYYTFKGGTSLSKGWGVIERFSEDIDIALNIEAIGESYIEDPSHNFVKRIRRKACFFTSNQIVHELELQFKEIQLPVDCYFIESEPIRNNVPDTDPQTIYVHFKSLYSPNTYVLSRVKIEFSVRSKIEPHDIRGIQTLLQNYYPNDLYRQDLFPVRTIRPELTLIEKILLLHELLNRTNNHIIITDRVSRHYYDLYRLSGHFSHELPGIGFVENLIQHRRHYSRINNIDYNLMNIGNISMLPFGQHKAEIEKDYQIMQREMLYGDVPSFREIMQSVEDIQSRINALKS